MKLKLKNTVVIISILVISLLCVGSLLYFYRSENIGLIVNEKKGIGKSVDQIVSGLKNNNLLLESGKDLSNKEIIVNSDIVLTGTAPLGTEKIKIKRINGDKEINYELKKYKKGETEWRSILQWEYGNIDQGKNTYEVVFTSENDEIEKKVLIIEVDYKKDYFISCTMDGETTWNFMEKIFPNIDQDNQHKIDKNIYPIKCVKDQGGKKTSITLYLKNLYYSSRSNIKADLQIDNQNIIKEQFIAFSHSCGDICFATGLVYYPGDREFNYYIQGERMGSFHTGSLEE